LGEDPKLDSRACWEKTNHGFHDAALKKDVIHEGARHQEPAYQTHAMVSLADLAIPGATILVKPGLENAAEVTGKEVGGLVASEPQLYLILGPTHLHKEPVDMRSKEKGRRRKGLGRKIWRGVSYYPSC